MDGEKGFLYAFGMCKKSLTLIGLWPKSKSSNYAEAVVVLRFTLTTLLIVSFVNIVQTIKLLAVWGDLDAMTDIISTANLPIAVAVFKMMVFYKHRKAFEPLLSFVEADWKSSDSKTDSDMPNMWSNAQTTRRISMICVILGAGTVNGHLFIRLGQEAKILPGKNGATRLPFVDSYFPYDYSPTPIYEITWAIQYIGAALATCAYSGIYCLFVALMLHLCGQFSNLREKLRRVVANEDDKRKFVEKLAEIVERHENLNNFARVIEKIFNLMFLAEILGCTIQFCMQGFFLLTLSSKEGMGLPILHILFMVIYVLHIGTHLFICCYVSEKLQDESVSIFRAAYNCEWYNLSAKDAMLLVMMMNRAKKPLRITAGKFCAFSLSLYAQIFKNSGGYLSMLLAVRDRIT